MSIFDEQTRTVIFLLYSSTFTQFGIRDKFGLRDQMTLELSVVVVDSSHSRDMKAPRYDRTIVTSMHFQFQFAKIIDLSRERQAEKARCRLRCETTRGTLG